MVPMGNASVLVAEPDDAKAGGIARVLTDEKIDLLRAESAEKALEILGKHSVDVLVVDDQLGGGGAKLIRRLIDADEQLAFVLATSDLGAEAENLGAEALETVHKP